MYSVSVPRQEKAGKLKEYGRVVLKVFVRLAACDGGHRASGNVPKSGPALARRLHCLFDVVAAQCPDPLAVETGQVLLSEPRVPLATQRLHAGQLSRDGDVLELGLQPQVERRPRGFSNQLAVQEAISLGVDTLQVEPGHGSGRNGRRPGQDLLRQVGGRKAGTA